MTFDVPGVGQIVIETIILDLNGTLSVGGKVVPGTIQRLASLKNLGYRLVLFTGTTRGDADVLAATLGIEWRLAKDGQAKRKLAMELGADTCASIGNGRIDAPMMEAVALSILTLQAEGVAVETLTVSDVIVPTIVDALDLFIDADRLVATLRR